MRLLFINAHYYPDVASTGQHLTDLAEFLAERGHRVSVLTGRARYVAGRIDSRRREVHNGVAIRRVRTTSFGRARILGRLADYASFYAQVIGHLTLGPRYDGVIFLTTPPLLSFVGRIARVLRGQRYGVWSMDLHPDAEIAAGMLSARGVLGRLLSWAHGWGDRGADLVVDLGAYMKRRLAAKGVAPSRLHTVHVWSRAEEIEPTERAQNPLARELGLQNRFVVMYSGNAGIVHDFRDVCEAMRLLRDDPRIFFLFVGGGPQRAAIEAYARTHALENFAYRDYFAREQLRHSLSLADVHLITLRAPFVGIAVPGKLYGIMASSRPALFVGPAACESADTIRDVGCGAVVDPAAAPAGGGARAVADLLLDWAANPARAHAMGARGRAAFLAHYERIENCLAFEDVLLTAWGARERVHTASQAPGRRAAAGGLNGA